MANVKPFIKNDFTKSSGKANIKMRVSHAGKTAFISTPFDIEPMYMKPDGRIDESYSGAAKLNRELNKLEAEYNDIIANIGLDIRQMSMKTLLIKLRNKDLSVSFTKFAELRAKELRDQGRDSYADGVDAVMTHLGRYAGVIPFSALTPSFLDGFNTYLKIKECSPNSRKIYMGALRAIFNVALDRELISLPSPFTKLRIKGQTPSKRALDAEDIKKFMALPLSDAQSRSRDLFMLILYLNGINLKDLLYIRPDQVYKGRIQFQRHKTDAGLSIKIYPEAQEIIDRWRGEKYLLRFMDKDDSYRAYKSFLYGTNELLTAAYGSKLTTYYARHSISSILANMDVPIETISMMLGHRLPGSAMTGMYITYNMGKVDEAMRKAIALLTASETKLSVAVNQ